jgi:hypothetical protein
MTNIMTGNATLTTNDSTNVNRAVTMLWSITNAPLPGTNLLGVRSVDFSSNKSDIITRRFFYEAQSNLSLTIISNNGGGTVVGHAFVKGDSVPSNNAALNIGEGYTLVAMPNSASLLGTWTVTWGVTNEIVTNGNTLHFVMESNTAIVATFVTNIFLANDIHGTYNGLFYALPQLVSSEVVTNTHNVVSTNDLYTNEIAFDSAGMLNNLAVNKQGAFSGRLLLQGNSYGLSGTFNASGQASNRVVARADKLGGPLLVNMTLDTNGGSLTGTITNANWPTNAFLSAGLSEATPGATNFTMLMFPTGISSTGSIPPGTGYALLADHGGSVTISGNLADGTPFNQTVPASVSNDIPVYASLYNKTGFLLGWLNLTNFDSTNVTQSDELMWIKLTQPSTTGLFPAGFTNLLITDGAIWSNLTALSLVPSNSLVISNGPINLDYTVTVQNNNKLVNAGSTPTNSLTGTVNLKNGLLQISFGNGDARSTTMGRGAVLQNSTNAGGYFVTKTNSGIIILNGGGSTNALENQVTNLESGNTQAESFGEEDVLGPDVPAQVIVITNGQ